MNRRSILMGVSAMAAVAACSPGLAPAAQEKIYPRAVLTEMWPIIRKMRGSSLHGTPSASLEEIETAVMKHFASFGIDRLPAHIESGSTPGKPVVIMGFVKNEQQFERFSQRELIMVYTYPGDAIDGQYGPHTAHIGFETHPTPL